MNLIIDDKLIKAYSMLIEQTFESFELYVRVYEVTVGEKDVEFFLEIALGTHIDQIDELKEDLALALASPTGDVEITAPVKGRSLISIKLPIPETYKTTKEKYIIVRIRDSFDRRQSLFEYLIHFFSDALLALSNLILKTSRFLRSILDKE